MAMMVALGSAVAGLKSEQTALDVIANNIANVNTTGYKSQTVNFCDILSQTLSSASASTATTGGVNAQQLGLGVAVASITTDMTVGSTSTTSNSTDVALTGAGYFVVSTGTDGEYAFTRAGNLTIDDSGNLNINGSEVCGWEAYTLDADGNKVYNTDGVVEPINIYSDDYSGNKQVMAAKATTSADITGTVSSSAEVVTGATLQNIGATAITTWDATTSIDVVDEQGNTTEVAINLKKCATEDTTTSWYWEASATDTTISPASGYIAFDSNGKMVTSVTDLTSTIDTAVTNTTGYSDSDISVSTGLTAGNYTIAVANSSTTTGTYKMTLTDPSGNTYTADASTDGAATFITSAGTVTLAAPTAIAVGTSTFAVATGSTYTFDSTPLIAVTSTTSNTNAVPVEMDFSALTVSSSKSLSGEADGYEAGTSPTYSISNDGTIVATYSNNKTQNIGQIALAVFENASGLLKTGDNLYTISASSGDYEMVVAGTEGTGTMTAYALELSNVDLASQFSSMMIAQRAYQANSKVISTADDMLQALISMKN